MRYSHRRRDIRYHVIQVAENLFLQRRQFLVSGVVGETFEHRFEDRTFKNFRFLNRGTDDGDRNAEQQRVAQDRIPGSSSVHSGVTKVPYR